MTEPINPQSAGQNPVLRPAPSGHPYYPQLSVYGPSEKFVGMAGATVILSIVGVRFSWLPSLDLLTMLGSHRYSSIQCQPVRAELQRSTYDDSASIGSRG